EPSKQCLTSRPDHHTNWYKGHGERDDAAIHQRGASEHAERLVEAQIDRLRLHPPLNGPTHLGSRLPLPELCASGGGYLVPFNEWITMHGRLRLHLILARDFRFQNYALQGADVSCHSTNGSRCMGDFVSTPH